MRSPKAAGPATLMKTPAAPAPSQVLTGRVQPQKTVSVMAPVAGTVASVMVEVGQDVYAGQLLAELSNGKLAAAQESAKQESEKARARVSDLSAELESAQLEVSGTTAAAVRAHATLTSAEKEFVRQQVLDREGATPHLTFLRARDDYQSALSTSENLEALSQRARERIGRVSRELDDARGNLQDKTSDFNSISTVSEIHAPVDGVVIAEQGKPGEFVDPGQTSLFQIAVNLSLLDVAIAIDAKTLAAARPGAAATVRIAEAGDVEIPATVREAGPGGMLVGFESPSPAIRPGMTALVRLAAGPQR